MKTSVALALLTMAALRPSLAVAEDTVSRAFKEPVTRVEIRNSAGKVHVHAAGSTVVNAKKKGCGEGQEVQVRVEGSTLFATFEPSERQGLRSCQVDFDVAVPANVAVAVDVGAADVRIMGIRGAVELESGSGDAVIEAEIGKLSVRVGSGDIDVKGLTGSARVEIGSGDVKLSYKSVPAQGTLKIDSGTGDIALKLPSQARFAVDFHSGVGTLSNALPTTKGAGFVVAVQSGTGDLSIVAAK